MIVELCLNDREGHCTYDKGASTIMNTTSYLIEWGNLCLYVDAHYQL
jgi:hypothetical protein